MVIERRSEMTLTTSELKDMVGMAMLSYLREERGECLTADECVNLVKWVDAHDFEESLEVIREEW